MLLVVGILAGILDAAIGGDTVLTLPALARAGLSSGDHWKSGRPR
jgi:hypothetical protein